MFVCCAATTQRDDRSSLDVGSLQPHTNGSLSSAKRTALGSLKSLPHAILNHLIPGRLSENKVADSDILARCTHRRHCFPKCKKPAVLQRKDQTIIVSDFGYVHHTNTNGHLRHLSFEFHIQVTTKNLFQFASYLNGPWPPFLIFQNER